MMREALWSAGLGTALKRNESGGKPPHSKAFGLFFEWGLRRSLALRLGPVCQPSGSPLAPVVPQSTPGGLIHSLNSLLSSAR